MNYPRSIRTGVVSRRRVLTGSILPLALAHCALAADVTWSGAVSLDVNPTYAQGLQEWRGATSNNNINQAANLFVDKGIVDRPRMGETNAKPADIDTNPDGVWSNNQVWRYTGQFYDADGMFTFAENIDDQVRLYIDGVEVINNDSWNTPTRSNNGSGAGNNYGMGPDGNGWHNFEVRFQNGGGGAGTVGENGWGGGDNNAFTNKGFGLHLDGTTSTNGADYILPVENMGNSQPDLFRILVSAGAGNDHASVLANTTITLSGTAATVTESSISFKTGATPVTLTVNSVDAIPRTLVAGTTYVGNGGSPAASSTNVTFDVSAGQTLVPGVMVDGTATGVSVTKTGAGTLIFNSTTASDLDGSTLHLNDGLTSVVATSGVNPLGNLPSIQIDAAAAKLRFGGGATFSQNIAFNQSGQLEHTASTVDHLSGVITVASGKTALTDVSNGVLRLTGSVNATGAGLTKTGSGTLVLAGTTNVTDLGVNGGRVEAHAGITLGNQPTYAGGTLALLSTGNNVPSGLTVPTNGNLEIIPGALTGDIGLSGGTLTLTAPIGLLGRFYNGGNAEARDTAFGGPSHPANTYANYTAYFNSRDTGGALGGPVVSTPTTTGGAFAFSFNPDGDEDAPYSIFGFNTADNLVTRMSGYVRVLQAGTYTFGTTSDDGSMLYVDGQAVVSNSADQGMTPRTGSINLTPGLHQIDIGMFEGTGGAGLIVNWSGPGFATQLMHNGNFRQVGSQSFANQINVTSNSTIDVAAEAAVANVTIQPGQILTKTGNDLSGVLTLNGIGNYGLDVSGNMVVTNVLNGGAATNLNKTGNGVLILDNTTTPQFTGGGIITVSGGSLGVLLQTGGSSPTGGATVNFNGGGVVLSSKGGDQNYAIPTFTGDGILEARRIGSGVAGATINLTGSLGIAAGQTITMGTADGYVMNVGGTSIGTGTLKINGGTVNATTNGAIKSFHLVMAPTATATTNWSDDAAVLSSLATQGFGTSTLVVGDGAGAASLTLNTAGTKIFRGHLNAASGNTLGVVMAGAGKQVFDNPLGFNQVSSFTLQNSAGTLELVGGGGGTATINLNGGTLQTATTGLLGQYFAVTPNAVANYNAFGTFQSYFDSLGTPGLTALTTTGGQTNMDFNNVNGGNDAPFLSQGFTTADNLQVRWQGRIYIGTAGSYNFTTTSDDGSMLFIDGATVVNNNFFQGMTPRSGAVTLSEGYHDLSLGFYEGGGGAGAIFSWQPPGASASTPIPNSVLSTTSVYTSTAPVNLNSNSTIDPRGGVNSFGPLTATAGTALTTQAGQVNFSQANLPTAGSYTFNPAGTLSFGNIEDGDRAVTLNKTGPGTMALRSPTDSQLQNASSVVNVAAGTLAAVGGTHSPLGNAAVNLQGNTTLQLSSSGGNATLGSGTVTLSGNATIAAGRYGGGAAGPAVVTLGGAVLIPGGSTLTAAGSVADNYTLNFAGNVSGPGSLAVSGGTVRIATANPAATSIANGGVLQLASSTYTGGAITAHGGTIQAASGTSNLGNAAITGSPITSSGTVGALSAALHVNFNNPTGGFGTDQGLATTLARTPEFTTTLTNDLNFGPRFNADGAFASFFGTTTASTDRFTAVFTGSYTALSAGSHSFRKAINDDNASFWVDLNQNGVFEMNGSSGNERITNGGCCGNSDNPADSDGGSASLALGQTYRVAVVLEDTGGGSSFAARFSTPSVAESYVNPSVSAGGIWATGTTSGGAWVSIESGAELQASSLTNGRGVIFNGTAPKLRLSSAGATTSDVQGIFNGAATNATIELAANNTLNVGNLTVAAGTTLVKSGPGVLTATAQDLGTGGTLKVEGGVVNLNGANGHLTNTGAVQVTNAVVNLNGGLSGAVTVNAGGTLNGVGSSGALTIQAGGTVAPGLNGIGTLNTGSVVLHDSATFGVQLQSGGLSDRLSVTGEVRLGDSAGSSLSLSLLPSNGSFTANPGDIFTLILNDGVDPVVGTFSQGGTVNVGGFIFNIAYDLNLDGGGVGNDVGLTYVVPEPSALVLLLGGLAAAVGLRRRRPQA